ncbi:MAG TPA: cell division protein SepF [Acidimicrobiales bacterium]|nr:cell division protein SepF [Acidimicrobiales bacterium]
MPGTSKKVLMWLGLADAEEYDEYEAYDDSPAPAAPPPRRSVDRALEPMEMAPQAATSPAVRTLPREGQDGTAINLRAASAQLRPLPNPVHSNGATAMAATATATLAPPKVHVAIPSEFADAQDIADRFRSGQPVIVNLAGAYRELAHRMIDFCSGVAYALGGTMDKVADRVFLMTPSNVELSAEEKRRLQERGFYRS